MPDGVTGSNPAVADSTVAATVAAIATSTVRSAGIGIVRVSGPNARDVASQLFARLPEPRRAALRNFCDSDGNIIDRGLVLFFPMPASYTGEDMLELHAHGGIAVLQTLLARVIEAGARPARPGEFTERAFLNGQLDLAQAEAVADLIEAGSAQAARAAHATLRGEFSTRLKILATALMAIRVKLEAGFDFSEEELGDKHLQNLMAELRDLANKLQTLLAQAIRGVRLRDGLRVVLVGAPNVGKSSVLNRLANEERAIVTAIPGTTRDVIREHIQLNGVSIELMDTAGLHESDDAVERIGMAHTVDRARSADLVLLVSDDRDHAEVRTDLVDTDGEVLVLINKIDLTGAEPGWRDGMIAVSAATGDGFAVLIRELERRAMCSEGGGEFSARQRHVDCLQDAMSHVQRAIGVVESGLDVELCAEDLRQCQNAFGRITGTVTSDDLLGEIFSTFCIGK